MVELEEITKKEANELFLHEMKADVICWSVTSVYSGIFFIAGLTGSEKSLDYEFLGIPLKTAILGLACVYGLISGLGFRKVWNNRKGYHSNPEEYVQKHYGKKLIEK